MKKLISVLMSALLIFAFAGLKRNLLISLVLILCYAVGFLLSWGLGYIGITIVLF